MSNSSLNPLHDFFAGFRSGAMRVGHAIGEPINAILLTFAYIVGIGPVSIIGKLVGKRYIDVRHTTEEKSHWHDHVVKTEPLEKYRRQF